MDVKIDKSRREIISTEIDGLFRQALAAAESEGIEPWNHLTRSRFRHLRAFAGLWLLFDALGGAHGDR